MSILNAIKSCVVKSDKGEMDLDLTMNKVRAALLKDMESQSFQNEVILNAINQVFAALGTNRVPTPRMVSLAAVHLCKGDLTQMNEWSNKVQEYLDYTSGFTKHRGRKGGLEKK